VSTGYPRIVIVQAVLGLAFLLAVLAAAMFVPAGTLAYWEAWAFLTVFATAVIAITVDLARRDPALLARRVHAGPIAEKTRKQQVIQGVASLAFLATFVIAAFDRHSVPAAVAVIGDAGVALGLWIVFRVFRANTFTSAIIEVEREQTLVTSGPYAHVRHPMYAGALAMMLATPLALGSWWALLAVAVLAAVIVARLLDEERVLAANLPGYREYRERVRYRLVPFVW
jgi:protein-S-isoprenylcysteine O-methyltransferase Ste14